MQEWQPMDSAPRDGTVIEALSLDWGTGPGETIYHARSLRHDAGWLNWDDPNEELDYLKGWRPMPAVFVQPPTHQQEDDQGYWEDEIMEVELPDTAYILFEDIPLERLENTLLRITGDMAVEAALIAYQEGNEAAATEIIKALVDALEPRTPMAASQLVDRFMAVIRAA